MKKIILICAVILSAYNYADAQVPTCGSNVPYYFVDFTGNPAGSWVSPGHSRLDNCCGTSFPDLCTSFEVICDTNAAMIVFEIESGAVPSGSMFYQINCGPPIPVGQPICITGPNPHYITFCKPGNNQNTYRITSISKPIFPPADTTRIGCSHPIILLGMVDSTCTWNSIYPGAPGDYNSYLNCTSNCDTTIYTPDVNAPLYIDYYVCGTPIATPCGYVSACDTVRMYNMQPLTGITSPNPAAFCLGGPGDTVSATAAGGLGPYSFIWRDQSLVQVCSGASCILTSAGIYSVEISDALTDSTYCPNTFISTTVIVTPPPIVDAGPDQTLCPTNPVVILNGSVQYATGGIWSGGAGTYNPGPTSLFTTYSPTSSEIVSGSVTLTLTSTGVGGGCTNDSDQVTIFFPAPLVVTIADTTVNCFGDYGSLTAVVSGGVVTYSYQWTTGQISTSVSVGQGTYCVVITDLLGCTTTSCGTVFAPPPLYISMSATPCSTNGGNDGTATTTVTGGTPPYTYSWSTADTTTTITGLSYGFYTVIATDANGCTIASSVVVNEPRCDGFAAAASGTDINCFGGENGTATATPNSGTAPYTYLWNDLSGQTTTTAINLLGGVYQCIITDAVGCLAVVNISLTQPTALANTMTHTNVTTVGGSDGSASANPMGGISPYTYLWSTGATSQSISGLSGGMYSVLITDLNGCTITDSIMINEPPCANLVAGVAPINVSCNGGNNGTATAVVLLGNDPYTYLWSTGETTSSISGLTAGNYNVTITDSINCSTFVTFSINEPSPLSIALAPVNISCPGVNDGTIELTVNGGTFPYTYIWTNGLPTEDLINLSAGSYTVTVTDANGCQAIGNATITEPGPIVITSSTTPAICFGESNGSIDASVSGGVPSYTFSWSNGATSLDISGLATGQYILTVTDGNGCTTTHSALVDQPTDISVSGIISQFTGGYQISCNGAADGSINLTISGGAGNYTYNWSTGSTLEDINGLGSGTYSVVVTDANGCTDTMVFVLSEPNPVSASIFSSTNFNGYEISCNGNSDGAINLTAAGGVPGYSFVWSTGDTTEDISGLGAGTYSVTITDMNGCTYVTSLILSEPPLVAISGVTQDVLCNGPPTGSINITVSGGVGSTSYAWSNGAITQDISSLAAGTYSVIVTDQNNCTATASFTIIQLSPATATIVTSDYNGFGISCNGASDGSIDLTVIGDAGPYTFNWSNGATSEDLSGIPAGSYTVIISDTNGCQLLLSVNLTEPPVLFGAITSVNDFNGYEISCNGSSDGSIDLSIGGGLPGYTFTWSNGATTEDISNLSAGTYSVLVIDSNGCTITAAITLSTPPVLDVNAVVISVACNGSSTGEIDITVTGGVSPYTYIWSNGSVAEDVNALFAGTYSVVITDQNGCTLSTSFSITEPTPIAVTSTLSDYNGYNVSCNGSNDGSIDLNVTGGSPGYTFSWSNSATSEDLTGVGAGTYTVIITDANGCSSSQSFVLTEPLALGGTIVSVNDFNGFEISCNGSSDGAIDLSVGGGNPAFTYSWSNGATSEDISGLAAGSYSVTVTDQNGCSFTASINLSEPEKFISNAVIQDISCNGFSTGSIDLSVIGGVYPYTYSWSNGATSQDIINLGAGTYSVIITDDNGCVITGSYEINELAPVGIDAIQTGPLCTDDNNCTIDLTINGGNLPYSFVWSNGATTEDLVNISAGTYIVTVTDANNCSATDTFYLVDPLAIISGVSSPLNSSGYNISNFGMSDGSIDLTVEGGVPPYTYQWSNGATTEDLSGIPAGTYSVIITDANGCQATEVITLSEPYELEMPTGFSPNGDGLNDFFEVHGLEAYPNNTIEIYNRWGNLVWDATNYTNRWNGTNEAGDDLPDATYFVILNINNGAIILKGYVDIRR